MGAELDMSQYLDLFLQEAEEQLEVLEQETLRLEQEPTHERMSVIFRAAHTLKGSSRAMGFANFAELTHEMENVLDRLRSNTLTVSTKIADALLACQDTLQQMVEAIANGRSDSIDAQPLVEELRSCQSASEEAIAPPAPGPAPESQIPADLLHALSAAAESGPVYHAQFSLAPECVMKFVRAYMAISLVEEAGELLVTVPDRESLEDEKFQTDFELLFQTAVEPAELERKFATISELSSFTVTTWAPVSGPSPTDGPSAEPGVPLGAGVPAEPPVARATAVPARGGDTGQTVRVDVGRLDNLMNLVGELVIDRTRIAQIGSDLAGRFKDPNIEALEETVGHIARITGDLQDQIMKVRMMPIETVLNRFPRVVRDLAQKLGKDVRLELVGGETELDRSVIEVIGDPLLHILRNSVDHGVERPADRRAAGKPEQGRIVVSAKHQENHIVIEIEDDGRGIDADRIRKKAVDHGLLSADQAARLSDRDALQFIFHSGLSTAHEVSEVSGRGVGMDIVRSNIQRLGGLIELETVLGQGTRFTLRLPLTLAIIRGLLVDVAENVYVLPLGSVVETLLVSVDEVQRINRREVIVIRGLTTPLLRLRPTFGHGALESAADVEQMYVVIVGLAEQRVGLVVDRLVGEQEVVIKSLSRFCGDVPGVSGATILGDGNVALIVDVNGIVPSSRGETWH